MTYLINLSFQQGIFPEVLKTTRVNPIFKKEDPQLPSSYCPISVLSVFGKLYEKCICSRPYVFLTKYKLFFKNQFGFRNNHSTSHAWISLIDLTKKYPMITIILFVEFLSTFNKAFNTVNHEILFVKIDFYGIGAQANR